MADEKNIVKYLKDGFQNILNEYTNALGNMVAPKAEMVKSAMDAFEEQSMNLAKNFGVGRDRLVDMKQSFGDALTSVVELGGGLNEVSNIATDIGASLNRNMILMSDSYSELYATQQVAGVGARTLATNFKDAGYSIYNISNQMADVVNTAVASGVNAKTVSSAVVSNLGLMDKYNFAGGVEGLAKMVTQATNLRISVNDISATMAKAFNPEQAIELAAGLQRLGVAQSDLLDPLRLMDLAQNDPAELQNQIAEMSKSFVRFNEESKSFEIAPGAKRQMAEIEKELGMSTGSLAKMAKASAELDDKMKKISFPDDVFSEEQKTFIANMAEMDEGGEYKLRIDGDVKSLEEAMELFKSDNDALKNFMKESEPKTMEEIAKSQLTYMETIDNNIRKIATTGLAPAIATSDVTGSLNEAMIKSSNFISNLLPKALETKGMREGLIDKNVETVKKGVKSSDYLGMLGGIEENLSTYIETAFTQFGENATKGYNELKESTNPVINKFTSLAEWTDNLITKHEKLNGNLDNTNTSFINLQNTISNSNVNKTLDETSPKTMTYNTSDIKFSEPLKIEIALAGLKDGINEEDLKRIIIEGKLNQIIEQAVAEALKDKIKK